MIYIRIFPEANGGSPPTMSDTTVQKWRCPYCGLKIEDLDSKSFRQRVIFHRKMHDEK
jgi:hypothetical protein